MYIRALLRQQSQLLHHILALSWRHLTGQENMSFSRHLTLLAFISAFEGPAVRAQTSTSAGPCNHKDYYIDWHSGLEDQLPPTQCGVTSATVCLALEAGGKIKVVLHGEIEGSVCVTVQTPSQCPTAQKWHSDDVFLCSPPDEETQTHCNQLDRLVDVKYYENLDPCPMMPSIGDFFEELTWDQIAGLAEGVPITLTCGKLVDKTDTLAESAKKRWTAALSRCTDSTVETLDPRPAQGHHSGEAAHSLSTFVHHGSMDALELDPLLDGLPIVAGRLNVSGIADFLAEVSAPGDGLQLPEQMALALAQCPSMDWVDGLSCNQQESYQTLSPLTGAPVMLTDFTQSIVDLRSSGDFSLLQPESYVDSEGVRHSWVHQWLRSDGDLYCSESSSHGGVVAPGRTGAAARAIQLHLDCIPYLQRWLSNPFGVTSSSYWKYTTVDQGAGFAVIEMALDLDESDGPLDGFQANFLGDRWRFHVELSDGQYQIISKERWSNDGVLRHREQYGQYAEVRPSISRPMSILIEEFDSLGNLLETTSLSLSGRWRESATPSELVVPTPQLEYWRVQLQ